MMIEPSCPTSTSLAAMYDFLTDHARTGAANEFRIFAGFVVDVKAEELSDWLAWTVNTSPELDNAHMVLPPHTILTTRFTVLSYLVTMKLSLINLELTSSGNESFE